MPPKQKPKKTGVDERQIQNVYKMINQYWPEYPVTLADLRSPTRDFVLKFYITCVENLDQKCSFITRSDPVPYPSWLTEEELLYLKISKIYCLMDADFRLGDLYTFDPKRVNNHILVTIHFLISTELAMDDLVQICNKVFDTEETMSKNQEELNNIKEERDEKKIKLTLAKMEDKKLKEIANNIAPTYEKTLKLIEESENNCKEAIVEVEKLKSKLEMQKDEIEKQKKLKEELRKQIVPEEEYNLLKNSLNSLIKEQQNLEEIDMSNGLLEQKQHTEQLQMCLQELNNLNLPEELYKLSDIRVQVKNEQQNIEHAQLVQQSSETQLKQLKTKLEHQKKQLQIENRNLQNPLKKLMENNTMEEAKLKKTYQERVMANTSTVEELNKVFGERQKEFAKLKKELQKMYGQIWENQNKVLERFEQFVRKVKR